MGGVISFKGTNSVLFVLEVVLFVVEMIVLPALDV